MNENPKRKSYAKRSVDRRVINALKRLEANPGLRVSDLAKLEGLSRSRLEYIVRENLNTDIRSYKRVMRTAAVLRAASDILESDAPLKCIQHDCGFNHRGHFIRCFRLVVGTTPADWRRHGSRKLLDEIKNQHDQARNSLIERLRSPFPWRQQAART